MSALYGTDAQFSRAQGSYDRLAPADSDRLWDDANDYAHRLSGKALARATAEFLRTHPHMAGRADKESHCMDWIADREFAELTNNAPTREPEAA